MPSFSNVTTAAPDNLEPDHEHFPVGHYRGRGNEQSGTGPSGPWLNRDDARYLRERAPHAARGRGPRGYVRPDARIYEEVCDALADHGDVDAREIEVRVENGTVYLSGTVDSRYAKLLTEHLASLVFGVTDVENAIRVVRPATE